MRISFPERRISVLALEGLLLISLFITRHSPNKQAELMPPNYGLLAALSIRVCSLQPAHISANGCYT